jgi:hypothetical protein
VKNVIRKRMDKFEQMGVDALVSWLGELVEKGELDGGWALKNCPNGDSRRNRWE